MDAPPGDSQPEILGHVARLRATVASFPKTRRRTPFVAQHNEMDCAAACLETIIRYYGKRAGLARCREAVQYHREGASLFDIQLGAESLGFECLGVRADFKDDLDSLPLPFIVAVDHHFVVVEGRDGNLANVMDPAIGRRQLPLEELSQKSQGICLLLVPQPAFHQWRDYKTDHSRYWRLAREHAPELLRALFFSLLLLGLGTVAPWFSRFVFDEVIPLKDLDFLGWIAVGYVAVIFLSALGGLARKWVITRLAAGIDRKLTVALYQRFFRMPLTEFLRRTPGDISATLTEASTIREFITGQVVANLLEYLNLVVYFCMLVWMAPQLVPLTLAVAPVYAVLPKLLGPVLQRLHSLRLNKNAKVETLLMEHINGHRTLKALGAEEQAQKQWEQRLDDHLQQSLRAERTIYPLDSAVSIFQVLVRLACLVLAARWVIADQMTIGAMIAGTQLVSQILGPVAAIAENWTDFQELKVSTERVEEALSQPEEDAGGSSTAGIAGDVELKDVTFRYGRAERPVLNAFSATFNRGEITALVGRSGSGKTTISQLLNRLLTAESGAITIGGHNICDFPLQRLRQAVGVALPEYHLFQGSVLDNIALGSGHPANQELAEAACKQAQIHDFVAALPSGYQTRIPESGMGLSSGQKQRLALARILYRDPPILLLDEVTSYLDQAAERAILSHLHATRKDKTIIIVTHRPNVLAYADRVITLKDGALWQDLRTSDPAAQAVFETI